MKFEKYFQKNLMKNYTANEIFYYYYVHDDDVQTSAWDIWTHSTFGEDTKSRFAH